MDILKIISGIFVVLGRSIEFFVSGQSDFNIIKSDFDIKKEQSIINDSAAKKLLAQIRKFIDTELYIKVKNPVVLELVRDPASCHVPFVKNGIGKYHSHRMFYEKYHMIYIVSGLTRDKFSSVIAHELMHAFLYENGVFIDNQPMREAAARWAEYSFLILAGSKKEASKLLSITRPEYGGELKKLLELEKKIGRKNIIRHIVSEKNIGNPTV